MPATQVLFYRELDGGVPALEWLEAIRKKDERVFKKCFASIVLLEQKGHELRRPHADILRDGVHELRVRVGKVNYRLLYGFVGKDVALLACGLTKENKVPPAEIDRAAIRIEQYNANPNAHRFSLEEN